MYHHLPVSKTLLSRVAAIIPRLAEGSAPVATVTQAGRQADLRCRQPPIVLPARNQVNLVVRVLAQEI